MSFCAGARDLAPRMAHVSRRKGARICCLLAIALLAVTAVARASDISPAESARIEYLLAAVASLPGAQFMRNGQAYDAKAAVGHLRFKLRLAGSHVKTAEDFIRYCATGSSVSGKAYEIRFADGRIVPSAVFLRQTLKEFDDQRARGG